MIALIWFQFEEQPEADGIFGLAPLWFKSSGPAPVETVQRGCNTCDLVTVTTAGLVTDRFKRLRRNVSVAPYCPACYIFPVKGV